MKKYSHLNKSPQYKFNWPLMLMQKAMPKRAFKNELTKNLILSIQSILIRAFKQADRIMTYKSF